MSGQIQKSNFTSLDNPLKYPQSYNYNSSSNNNNNNSNSNFSYYNNSNGMDNNVQKYALNRSDSVNRQYQNTNTNNTPSNRNYYPTEMPPPSQSPQYNNQVNPNQYQSTSQMNQYQPPPPQSVYNSQSNPNLNQPYSVSPRLVKKDSEIRVDMENVSKQAYKRALDQQVAEKQVNKYVEEKERKQNELAMIPQYPFGRRTNPSYLVDDNYAPNQNYQPSFNGYGRQNYDMDSYNQNQMMPKLDKNHMVEKPNSLSDDIPPYDPVKESKGGIVGSKYDPWGKPGGGAPMIDPDTGRKFTKISGQLFYDTIGLTPSARQRHKEAAVKQHPISIEEQKVEMEIEAQRRRHEEEMHRSRAGDVATWIQDIEGSRWPLRTHLNHTNVTRDKVNLEYARRGINDKTKIYHDELGLQLEERERQNKLHKLREDVAGIEHTRHWNDWWGRPGGGAPNTDKRRHQTHEILESPRFHWDRNVSSEAISNSTGTSLLLNNSRAIAADVANGNLLFTKGTKRSNHKNFFENEVRMK